MGTGGPFGALAAGNISANTARFARDLTLYTNPNDPRRDLTVINRHRHVAEHWLVRRRVCASLNSRSCPCVEHLLPPPKKKKWCADTHTRSSTSVIAAATVESSTSTAGSARRKTHNRRPQPPPSAPVSSRRYRMRRTWRRGWEPVGLEANRQ